MVEVLEKYFHCVHFMCRHNSFTTKEGEEELTPDW